MKTYIHHLRQKPHHIREKIALTASIVITALIFVVWISTFTVPTSKKVANDKGPFEVITENVASTIQSIKGDIDGLKVYSETEDAR